jgi:hypothetical protein
VRGDVTVEDACRACVVAARLADVVVDHAANTPESQDAALGTTTEVVAIWVAVVPTITVIGVRRGGRWGRVQRVEVHRALDVHDHRVGEDILLCEVRRQIAELERWLVLGNEQPDDLRIAAGVVCRTRRWCPSLIQIQ